jgi:hypothetical protein
LAPAFVRGARGIALALIAVRHVMSVLELTDKAAPALLTEANLCTYLESRLGGPIRIVALALLGGATAGDVKGFGYGTPIKIDYEKDGERRSAVLETITPGRFGHEHMADRAQSLLWSHHASNSLPLHVRSLDVGGFRTDGKLTSVGDIEEFFILNEYVPGDGYFHDLERLRDGGARRELDVERADALCDYLVRIHRLRGSNPELYVRRVRELVGHNECIAGILDAYPLTLDGTTADVLESIEHACVRWRWRLKPLTHRLRQVHGDFHPWNILFQDETTFAVLDRSRGEWGDPADDVAALTANYVFFSLQKSGRLEGAFATLFARFWRRYVDGSGDRELADVVAPFFAFRWLVMANPVWYPNLAPTVRGKMLTLVRAVLDEPRFDPLRVNEYCEAAGSFDW